MHLMKTNYMRGFTLIEVLVAVLILSIGLLGVAGLQLSGLRYNQSAYLRSQATTAIADIVDRMRSNPDAVKDGAYNEVDTGDLPEAGTNCSTSSCTAAELAVFDIRAWANQVTQLPPPPAGTPAGEVDFDSATEQFTITVRWGEQNDTDGSIAAQSVQARVRL